MRPAAEASMGFLDQIPSRGPHKNVKSRIVRYLDPQIGDYLRRPGHGSTRYGVPPWWEVFSRSLAIHPCPRGYQILLICRTEFDDQHIRRERVVPQQRVVPTIEGCSVFPWLFY